MSIDQITDFTHYFVETEPDGTSLPEGIKLAYYRGKYKGQLAFGWMYLSEVMCSDGYINITDILKIHLYDWCLENTK